MAKAVQELYSKAKAMAKTRVGTETKNVHPFTLSEDLIFGVKLLPSGEKVPGLNPTCCFTGKVFSLPLYPWEISLRLKRPGGKDKHLCLCGYYCTQHPQGQSR